MTKEEAIFYIKELQKTYASMDKKVVEAVDMAIEALQFVEHFDLLKEFQSLQEVVRCKDCRHEIYCYKTIAHTRIHNGFKEHWSEPIDFCSRGERKEE
jgi:hypothetical protein